MVLSPLGKSLVYHKDGLYALDIKTNSTLLFRSKVPL